MRSRSHLHLVVSALLSVAGASLAGSAAAAEILSVKNESANFREGPGEKHPIVFAADKFYPVEVVEKKDGWARVKDFEGDVAWVAERLLGKQETVVVEGDRVNVRDKASTTSEIVFKAERGEVFKVEERQGKWLKVVDASGDGGWIRDDMVWGERVAMTAPPKGKTKGELEPILPPGEGEKGKAAPAAKPEKQEPKPEKQEPKGDAPADAPKGEAPKGDAPKGDAPKGDAPKADAPKGDAPKGDAPKADAPEPPADDAG